MGSRACGRGDLRVDASGRHGYRAEDAAHAGRRWRRIVHGSSSMTKSYGLSFRFYRHLVTLSLFCGARMGAQVPTPTYVSTEAVDGRYPLAANGRATPISVSPGDFVGVQRAARDLAG